MQAPDCRHSPASDAFLRPLVMRMAQRMSDLAKGAADTHTPTLPWDGLADFTLKAT